MDTKIKEIVKTAGIGPLKSYTWLGNGFSSNAYQLDTDQGSYVLLETKKNAVDETSYKTYFVNLRCLERSGFTHAPKAVYLSDDTRSMVTTKVPGDIISHFNTKDINERKSLALKVADTLLQLKAVQPEILKEELAAVGLELPPPFTQKQDWEKYAINTFYPYKDDAPDDAETDWIEAQITSFKLLDPEGDGAVFHHGDTSEPNILVTDNYEIYFIDWGSARFYASSEGWEDFGLAYVMNHVKIMQEFKEEVLQHVATQQNIDYQSLRDLVYERQKEIKISDITWAYMMYIRALKDEVQDPPEKFKSILDTRIEEYKKDFLN